MAPGSSPGMSGVLASTTASRSTGHGRQYQSEDNFRRTEGQQLHRDQAAARSSQFEPRPFGAPLSPGEEESFAVNSSSLTSSSSQTVVQPSDIVFGIPFDNKELSGVMRKVILIASFGATTYICRFLIDLMFGVYSQRHSTKLLSAMSSLLIELSVPACGYFGALHHNRQLMCCFCSCNLFISVVTALSFVRLNLWAAGMEGGCEGRTSRTQQQTCELWTGNSVEKFVMLVSMVLVALTGIVAFWFGNKLFQHLSQDFYVYTRPPLVGEVTTIITFPTQGAYPVISDGVFPQMSQEVHWRTAEFGGAQTSPPSSRLGTLNGAGPETAAVTVEAAGVRISSRSPSQSGS